MSVEHEMTELLNEDSDLDREDGEPDEDEKGGKKPGYKMVFGKWVKEDDCGPIGQEMLGLLTESKTADAAQKAKKVLGAGEAQKVLDAGFLFTSAGHSPKFLFKTRPRVAKKLGLSTAQVAKLFKAGLRAVPKKANPRYDWYFEAEEVSDEMLALLEGKRGYSMGGAAAMDLPGGGGDKMAKGEFLSIAKGFNSALSSRTDRKKLQRLKVLLGTLGVLMKGIDGAEMASVHVRKALRAIGGARYDKSHS